MDNQTAAVQFFANAPALYLPEPVPMASLAPGERLDLVVGTSPWWIDRLSRKMANRQARLTKLRNYYRGEQDTLRLASEAFRLTFGRWFYGLKSNLAKLVVLAPEQRLHVEGFRIPMPMAAEMLEVKADAATSVENANQTVLEAAEEADDEAWRIWQANGLDSRSAIAHTEALVMGECPILVDRDPDDPRTPRITVEDPMQVVVERDPADPNKRRAAMKRFTDDDGSIVTILYLPDRIEWWRSTQSKGEGGTGFAWVVPNNPDGMAFSMRGIRFELDTTRSGRPPVPGIIPVIPLVNLPRIDGSGEGEHECVLPLLDLLNKTILDMATTSEFAAFPQRYAMGVSLDEEADELDANGKPMMPAASSFKAAVDRMWTSENPDASFGEFPAADLKPYTDVIDAIVQQIGSITFTPYHLLLNMPSAVPATGEALKTAESGLVKKTQRKQIDFGEGWEEVMRVAFLTVGDTERATAESETIWARAETINLAALATALQSLSAFGVPDEQLWIDAGYSAQQIKRFKAERVTWPENLGEKIAQARELIDAGFDAAETLAALGLPKIKHLGLPPKTLQTIADAEGGPETPINPDVPPKTAVATDTQAPPA